MDDLEDILRVKKKALQIVFNPKKWSFNNNKIETQYRENGEHWKKEFHSKLKSNPFEVTALLNNLLQSDFTVKFINDWSAYNKIDRENWTSKQRVDFIQETFEFAYHYFIILFLAQKDTNIKDLFEYWYIPEIAKERPKKGLRKWKDGNYKQSGKNWIIKNLALFDNYNGDISRWREIRNYKSHGHLIEKNNKIYKRGPVNTDITDEVYELSSFIFSSIGVNIHFLTSMLLIENIWIFPYFLSHTESSESALFYKGDFNFLRDEEEFLILPNKKSLNRFINFIINTREKVTDFFKTKLGNKEEEKENKLKAEELYNNILVIMFLFTTIEIWIAIKDNISIIQDLLSKCSYVFEFEKFAESFEESSHKAQIECFTFSILLKQKFFDLKQDDEESMIIENLGEMTGKDLNQLWPHIQKNVKLMIRQDTKTGYFMYLILMHFLISKPLTVLQENMDKLIIKS